MSTKQEIIDKINQLNDPILLEELNDWISSVLSKSTSEPSFSEQEIMAVKEGFEQYKAGKTFSQQQANQLFEQWLNEK